MARRSKHDFGIEVQSTAPTPGVCYQKKGLRLQLVREAPFEIFFQTDVDIVTLSLAHTNVECAFDSDRLSPQANRPGMLNFHPAGTQVFVRSLRREGEMIIVETPPSLRASLSEDFVHPVDSSRVSVSATGVIHLAQSVRRFLMNDALGGHLVAESLATLSMAETLGACSGAPRRRAGLGESQLSIVLDFIESRLNKDVGLADLAETCGLSLSHFARSFKAVTGVTPHRYVLERRVSRARDLLSRGKDSIAEVAYACGFSSQSHMTDTFRRLLNTTPARYRKETQK